MSFLKWLAGAACALCLPALAEAQAQPPWVSNINTQGWTLVDWNIPAGVAMLWRPAVQAAAYRRIWVRYEHQAPVLGQYGGSTVQSEVILEEVDCANARLRVLQYTRYTAANMEGEGSTSSEPAPWSYPIPGTFDARTQELACRR